MSQSIKTSALRAFAVEWPETGRREYHEAESEADLDAWVTEREGRADHTITLVKSDKELAA
jgi:hypothetical protein